ncbi:PREDICTED: uncharacterized protein LOC106816276 [Priapulus caudatus]|uniref:Uncharacterized protein LOC106816276 n=1 Tax=Priapulus caudatus TaxID=37621 RepID=A0ABM1EVX7_PRICU|nr:PREDICTED: uncharacterized protein LOC106816276 [Priapulus caudatus]
MMLHVLLGLSLAVLAEAQAPLCCKTVVAPSWCKHACEQVPVLVNMEKRKSMLLEIDLLCPKSQEDYWICLNATVAATWGKNRENLKGIKPGSLPHPRALIVCHLLPSLRISLHYPRFFPIPHRAFSFWLP